MALPQRLTALDASFLALSTPEVPFAPGCVLLLDRPVSRAVLASRIASLLRELPRYRQRIARAPLVHSLAWVDDEHFSLFRHVGVLHVPAPGGERELEAAVAPLLTLQIPKDHPPWRVWTVEGLAGGQGALVAVVHHALVDGVAGVGLLERLLRLSPEQGPVEVVERDESREAPPARPATERFVQRVAADLRGRTAAWRQLASQPELRQHARELGTLLWQGLHAASDLGMQWRELSGGRSFAMVTISLDETKQIKRAAGVTVNDVMLACIAGALRRWAARGGYDPDQLDHVRALVPVNRHARDEHATSGNRVALLLTELSVEVADPAQRLRHIAETTRALKKRDMAAAGDMLVTLSNLTWSGVLTNVFRLALARPAFNAVITNVPGPPVPLYLCDARVTRFVPIVNLWPHIPLAIAIGSYTGTITLAIDVDSATMPDPYPFVHDLEDSFSELRALA